VVATVGREERPAWSPGVVGRVLGVDNNHTLPVTWIYISTGLQNPCIKETY
jgi:hypothetical protein